MRQLLSITSNLMLRALHTDEQMEPLVELVITTVEADYFVDAGGQAQKEYRTETMRFFASPHGCRKVAAEIIKMAEDAEAFAAKFPSKGS